MQFGSEPKKEQASSKRPPKRDATKDTRYPQTHPDSMIPILSYLQSICKMPELGRPNNTEGNGKQE